jgi:ribosomal protein S1
MTTAGVTQEMPLLRFRAEGDDDYFEEPVTIMGHVTGVGDDVVTIAMGGGSQTQLYVEDFYEVLGGPEDALGIFIDAAVHADLVKIRLTRERLSYENDAQLERYTEKAP